MADDNLTVGNLEATPTQRRESSPARDADPQAAGAGARSRPFSMFQLPGEDIELREILRTLWRRKMLLVGTFALITIVTALVVLQLTPLYTAKAFVMIDSRKTQVVDVEAVLSGLTSDAATIASEVEVIQSRALARRVVDKLGLVDDPEFNETLRPEGFMSSLLDLNTYIPASWMQALTGRGPQAPSSPEAEARRIESNVINAFGDRLDVVPVRNSFVIEIAFSSESPQKAADIANAISEQYIVDQLEAKFEATRRATAWLNERIAELRDSLRESEGAAEAYRARSGLVQGKDAKVSTQRLSELNSQYILAKADRAEAEARLHQVETLLKRKDGVDSAAEVLTSPLIVGLRGQETEVLRRIGELSTRYGERHPKMINVRAELRDLRDKIGSEVHKIVQGLSNEVEVARAREESLQESLTGLEKEVMGQNRSEIRLRELEREAQANRLLYETFLSRFKETSEQKDIQQADARILSTADVPTVPSYPRKTLSVGFAGVASLFLGVLLVFLLERLDNGVRSPEQIEQLTGAPSLGMVPLIGRLTKRSRPENYVLEKPTSAVAEAVRGLRTTLMLSNVDRPPKVVSVASALPAEGKSTVALWLARVAASSGEKVLLIDCDLRRPTLHRNLDLNNDANIVGVLAGEISAEQAIKVDEPSGAHLILAKAVAADPISLLGSNHMKQLMVESKQRYDLVILDTPPLLAVSDARVIAQMVDKTVFLAKWDATPREAVIAGLKQLADIDADLAGVLLSQVNLRKHSKYGYSDSGYYYRRYREYYTD